MQCPDLATWSSGLRPSRDAGYPKISHRDARPAVCMQLQTWGVPSSKLYVLCITPFLSAFTATTATSQIQLSSSPGGGCRTARAACKYLSCCFAVLPLLFSLLGSSVEKRCVTRDTSPPNPRWPSVLGLWRFWPTKADRLGNFLPFLSPLSSSDSSESKALTGKGVLMCPSVVRLLTSFSGGGGGGGVCLLALAQFK